MGRPGLAPGVYFRCLLIGYFEGISSERGIAWRVADSLSLRRFLRLSLERPTPDHSTISRTRRRLPADLHERVFTAQDLVPLRGRGLDDVDVGGASSTPSARARPRRRSAGRSPRKCRIQT